MTLPAKSCSNTRRCLSSPGQVSLFPLQSMKFIILDTSRKCALNLAHQNQLGLKAVSNFEPKRERAGPGGLFPYSALGLDSETEGERFAMQLFKELYVLFFKACR